MLIFRKIPWFSLMLVMLSYTTLGWVISETKPQWFVWLVVVVVILLVLLILTTPWSKLARYYSSFLKSNTRSFGVTILAAFLFFVMIAWFRVFLDALLILSASILVKIDFQKADLTESLAFWFASIFSLAGLGVGAVIHHLI
ncbi:hypothetical protein VB711_12305 [Cronbergia sp. UHCC 0137]|uniref:hypothetical protein n=1 Tax=Cronbergia sp. UHCC 0137 TaxID=3110239 RepID=UPI002B20D614|nr:hypothetical protein [Cronbergia sp. UHCC 0137]MEA5618612.1 hypothetical protein [Cronbergia sp. UHCC 0137]